MAQPRSFLGVLIAFACFDYVIPANPFGSRYPVRSALGFDSTKHDVISLKRSISSLERENAELRAMMTYLATLVNNMNRTLDAMSTGSSPSSLQEDPATELTIRVESLEEKVDIIIDQEGIDLTETELDRFLGNHEAQLIDLDMDPDFDPSGVPTVPPVDVEELEVDQADLLGNALYSLNRQNAVLSSKVAELEQDVDTEEATNRYTVASSGHIGLENRVNQLERLLVNQAASSAGKNKVPGSRGPSINGPSIQAAGVSRDQHSSPLDDDEQEALREVMQNVGGAMSLFSVTRTSSIFGINRVPKPIPFETELAIVGGEYSHDNGTFTCTIPGYYFITFTARTFDYKYLNVNLMKNEGSLTAIYSDKHKRNVMQTQSIITQLDEGDQLWLRMPPSKNYGLQGDRYQMTTFTGFLLYQQPQYIQQRDREMTP